MTKLTSTVEEMERNTEEVQVIDEHLRHHVMETFLRDCRSPLRNKADTSLVLSPKLNSTKMTLYSALMKYVEITYTEFCTIFIRILIPSVSCAALCVKVSH